MKKQDIINHLPITTERLLIRRPTADDINAIQRAKIARSEDMRRWMSWASPKGMSREGTADYIQLAWDEKNTIILPLIAVHIETGEFILSTSLDAEDEDFTIASTGWWIDKKFEGQGFGFEAMTAIVHFAHHELGVRILKSCYYEGNKRSQSLMERLGFSFVEIKPKEHKSHLDGIDRDVYHYELRF